MKPRKLENDPNRWREVLECAMDHGNLVQGIMAQNGLLNYQDKDNPTLPPMVTDEPGTMGYHFAAFMTYICEVYWSISGYYPEKGACSGGDN